MMRDPIDVGYIANGIQVIEEDVDSIGFTGYGRHVDCTCRARAQMQHACIELATTLDSFPRKMLVRMSVGGPAMRLECNAVVPAIFASNGAHCCERTAMSLGYTTTPNRPYYLPCDGDSLVATCRRQVSMTMIDVQLDSLMRIDCVILH
jgi:hypothetical protein